uniref:Fungal lipase-type domain-containing protein n=1 Tax=Haptolina ericina TaxID=156174 RepID=A0A7S3F1C5_9EUKA|mmetsp:Transcript_45088/g.101830  ORF Transcript_45088/g.101830 Transcript_45088/m.101830 type:complete len:231 (+) Transcript_45088:1-693(+)
MRKVQMYTFGAPRVGNSQFAAYFNEVFDGREAFRIVNDADIVPRLPRGGNAAGLVLDYDHVGRTVLIAEGTTVAKGFDGFWVEGTSDDADCPLRGVSPLSNPFSSGQLLGDAGQQARQLASGAWSKIDAAAKEKSRSQLFKAVGEVTSDIGRARDSVVSRVSSMNPLEAVSLIGLDKQFVESELQLIDSIAKGTALVHHLEPSYFLAMTRALDAALGEAPGGMPDVEAEA